MPDVSCSHEPTKLPTVGRRALERAAALFRAAGDPERLRVLERLLHGEACVSELAELTEAGMSTISQRLRLLRADGLVKRRRESKHVYYALTDDHVRHLIESALEHASHPHEDEGDTP